MRQLSLSLSLSLSLASVSQLLWRWMTSSNRVQDRNRFKRVCDLKIAAEKHKVFAKVLYLFEILKEERVNIVTLRSLDRHRHQVNLPKPNMFSDFLRKVPKLSKVHRASSVLGISLLNLRESVGKNCIKGQN